MESFKRKLRIRIRTLTLLAVVVALIYVGFMMYRSELPVLNSFIKGFHHGIFFGLELIILGFLVQYVKASKSEEVARKLQISENDERTGLILQKAASLGTSVAFFGIGIATIVAGFLNTVAFVTLLGTLVFVLIVFFSMWGYFAKRI